MQRRILLAAGALLCAAQGATWAQSYPNRPVRLIVPFAPGSPADIIARVVSEKMNLALGQPMIVENKAGGGGSVGATELARSAPDGYTLGIATVSTTAGTPAINPRIAYRPLADFTPIINVVETPYVMAAHPSFPAKDYKGFLAVLKKSHGEYSYASSGIGGIGHLQMELFKKLSGTLVTHIPHRGVGPALDDTIAGQASIIFESLPLELPFIQQGRLVPIAVAAPHRVAQLPDIPTFKELGLEPVNRTAFYGVHGPAGLPREVVEKINSAVKKTLEDPAVKKRIDETGSLIVAGTPEQFAAEVSATYETYKKLLMWNVDPAGWVQ